MPVQMRAYLLSNVNMCWLIGQLLGVAVMRGLVHNSSQWSYRIPFGLQWVFAAVILFGIIFAPESPCKLTCRGVLNQGCLTLFRVASTTREITRSKKNPVAACYNKI
jgi:MFS transporter, SP family, general alpha glucoside:H+ symporter